LLWLMRDSIGAPPSPLPRRIGALCLPSEKRLMY